MGAKLGILGFLELVEGRVDRAISEGDFLASQRDLLLATAAQYRPRSHQNPLSGPLAVFYLIARAHKPALDEQGIELAAFCEFYLLALDLLDDIQDSDLGGKPHESVGGAMALNDAMTLLFLGLSALERGMQLESHPERRMEYLRLLNRVALSTGRGQHKDLLGARGARTPNEVLEMQREKTASITMICQCAALYAGVSAEGQEHYRVLGGNLALLVQVLDDVRDVYGKRRSPDLESDKVTYPLACFLEHASEADREKLSELKKALPESLGEIRRLLYDTGTLRRVAHSMEEMRRSIHHELLALDEHAPTLRLLLLVIDQLVLGIYSPKPVPETAHLRSPNHGWHGEVRKLAEEFQQRLKSLGAPTTPTLLPWHQSQWVYDKGRGAIFYPDIEGLPEETLPFQAALLGETDLGRVAALMRRQAPAVMAHELFHHYRDAMGVLSTDMWHEELVANTLAIAYCTRFEPTAVAGGIELAERVLARPEHRLSPRAAELLRDLMDVERPCRLNSGYQLDLHQTALVHLSMIRELARTPRQLEPLIEQFLSPGVAVA